MNIIAAGIFLLMFSGIGKCSNLRGQSRFTRDNKPHIITAVLPPDYDDGTGPPNVYYPEPDPPRQPPLQPQLPMLDLPKPAEPKYHPYDTPYPDNY